MSDCLPVQGGVGKAKVDAHLDGLTNFDQMELKLFFLRTIMIARPTPA
jgi:hypothetical protein